MGTQLLLLLLHCPTHLYIIASPLLFLLPLALLLLLLRLPPLSSLDMAWMYPRRQHTVDRADVSKISCPLCSSAFLFSFT